MGDPMVVFDGVSKKFRRGERHDSLRDLIPAMARRAFRRRGAADLEDREFWAVRDVSFRVNRGEALGIIGPNGAGKSTTLKLLTRILKPTVGQCATRGRVGALIEIAAGFHQDLTGRENIYLQGAIMGMRRAEIAARFDEIVDFAGVSDFIDTPVKRYSSGMNARLGFSIAAHLKPDVLIIDEVLAVGDVAFQHKCFRRMEDFLREGVAIVFVSHNLVAVSQLCKQALLLQKGEVTVAGSSDEAIAAYSRGLDTGSQSAGAGATVRVTASERPAHGTWLVPPGTSIRLAVDVTLQKEVRRATVGLVVWDLVRNLYVYGVSSDALAVPFISGAPGDTVTLHCSFLANLARGTYAVEINVFDMERHEHLIVVRPAAQFSVVEEVTYSGVANLFLAIDRVTAPEYVSVG